MRRALSILMMVVLLAPCAATLFAQPGVDEAGVPACCRRHGLHHCMMSQAERATLQAMGLASPEVRAPEQKCPFHRSPVRNVQQGRFGVAVSQVVYAALVSHPIGLAQTQSKWRVSRERARQTRGPPASLLC